MPSEHSEYHKNHPENEVITHVEWKSAGRPFKQRTKQFYLTALLIMLLIEVVLFLFSQYLLMAVVVSLVFVAFALNSVPPKDFQFKISSEGIMIEDKFFLWKELYDFYFREREGVETIHIRTESYIPGELILTFPKDEREKIKKSLLPYLPFREYVKPTFMDKSADWLTKNFPLEKK
ncbi:MAG: hypothetical protein A2171_02250 [Candidatus Levybacteria bacterium RBG_13_35_9]|nr:MAG: hypothetical protein A2171_02250 [Candidatus Levybacteria bacterium RBG_13_35_9]